jgi:hypothetical protein
VEQWNIPKKIEDLARAMCAAVDIDPDATFPHDWDWGPFPVPPAERIKSGGAASLGGLKHSAYWVQFAWSAKQWIFERTGKVPE